MAPTQATHMRLTDTGRFTRYYASSYDVRHTFLAGRRPRVYGPGGG